MTALTGIEFIAVNDKFGIRSRAELVQIHTQTFAIWSSAESDDYCDPAGVDEACTPHRLMISEASATPKTQTDQSIVDEERIDCFAFERSTIVRRLCLYCRGTRCFLVN